MTALDDLLIVWFSLTAISVAFIAWDLFTRTPEMRVMKWGWILVALYLGPIAFVVYWISCREPSPGTHEEFVAPLWKQTIGSTIHCLAGDATGVIVSAIFVNRMRLPMAADSAVEYIAGFAFGLLIFQALFMRDMLGGSYLAAVRATVLPEWLSMNAVMAGMIPVMTILMSRDMRAMDARSMHFWGVMSLATLAGAVLALPVNLWLVAKKLKHGMGTERALGKGGAKAVAETQAAMAHEAMPGMTMQHEMPDPGGEMPVHALEPTLWPDHDVTGGRRLGGEQTMAGPAVPFSHKVLATAITLLMLGGGIAVARSAGAFVPPSHGGMAMP